MMKKYILILFVVLITGGVWGQNPLSLQESELYDFIDEMANKHFIEINSCIKPYSRKEVNEWLLHIKQENFENLSHRQQGDLLMYLKEFNVEQPYDENKQWHWNPSPSISLGLDPLGGIYKDSLFRIMIRPLIGVQVFKSDN